MARVLIAAGGTGGHIFPALAVAEQLQKNRVEVYWLGSNIGLEKSLVPERFPMTYISAKRLRGKGWRGYLTAPWHLIRSIYQAWRAIRAIRPQAVLVMGGFVSGPGGLAAKLAGIPLIVHEQNAVAGYSNRLLASLANIILAAYPNAFPQNKTVKVMGNPVRSELCHIAIPEQRLTNRDLPLRLLILGGSQGAHAVNQCVQNALVAFQSSDQLAVWHQTGRQDDEGVRDFYAKNKISAKVEPFIDDIAVAYEWADLLLCRAGALTVSEITAVGIASILVPFPAAVDDHQWYNSQDLEKNGAAFLIRQQDLTQKKLIEWFEMFLKDRSKLMVMAEKARELAWPRAAEDVAAVVLSFCHLEKE